MGQLVGRILSHSHRRAMGGGLVVVALVSASSVLTASHVHAVADPGAAKQVVVSFPSHSSTGGTVLVTVTAVSGAGILTPVIGSDPTGAGFTGEFIYLTSSSSSLTFDNPNAGNPYGVTVNGQFSTTYTGPSGVTVTAQSCNKPKPLQTYCQSGSAATP